MPRRYLVHGALWGAAAGLLVALCAQILPRFAATPESVFSGAPQGLDQWTYFAMCRALWRSPNGLTYVYPYTLFWPAPAVMFQFPLLVLAWIGKLTRLPLAFEVGRIAGAAGAGAALAVIGRRLVRGRPWRWWFWVAAVLGGGWFTWAGMVMAVQLVGPDGLTEFWVYLPKAQGQLFWWAPFVAQNLRYPLECLYHALVFSALACLLTRRFRTALLLGFITWFSNPFTATALGAVVLPWWAWMVLERRGRHRRTALLHLTGWLLVTIAGWVYYGPFLGQWPVLKDVARQYHAALTPPLTPVQLLLLGGPWTLGLLWSVATKRGRRHVWGRPAWRLFALLALSQLALVQQGWVLGGRALQPFHFNRGYLHLGLVAVACRAATAVWRCRRSTRRTPAAGPAVVPRWAVAALVLTLGDQALFATHVLFSGVHPGLVDRAYADLVSLLPRSPAKQVVVVEYPRLPPSYVAAFSPHVSYEAPETMVVPFPEWREAILQDALSGRKGSVQALGVAFAIVSRDGNLSATLHQQGWTVQASRRDLLLLVPPE